jgi:hypothetical protein
MTGPKHVEVAHRLSKNDFLGGGGGGSKLRSVFTPILKHNGYVPLEKRFMNVTFIVGTVKTVSLRGAVRVDRWERFVFAFHCSTHKPPTAVDTSTLALRETTTANWLQEQFCKFLYQWVFSLIFWQ